MNLARMEHHFHVLLGKEGVQQNEVVLLLGGEVHSHSSDVRQREWRRFLEVLFVHNFQCGSVTRVSSVA